MLSGIYKKLIICLVIFFTCTGNLLSQSIFAKPAKNDFPFINIEYLNYKNGLNGSQVNYITQDKQGFMWFVTDHALNRYDGYSFRSWSNSSEIFIVDTYFRGLTEDKSGILWFPSFLGGLFSFNPRQEKFMNYRYQSGNNNSLINDSITSIATERNGIIWIGTESGLDKFNPETHLFTHFLLGDADSRHINNNSVLSMTLDEKNQCLWIVNRTLRLICFNIKSGKVIKQFNFPFPSSGYAGNSFILSRIKKDILWFGSNHNGIYGFNIFSEKFIQIKTGQPCHGSRHTSFYFVLEDDAGNLWTENDNNEIVYYDRAADKFYFYPIENFNIKFNEIPAPIIEDSSHKIWLATNNGLITIDTKQKNFSVCRHDLNNPKSISGDIILAIHRTRQGQLLVATMSSNSIDIFDKETKTFSRFPLFENRKKLEAPGLVWMISEEENGTTWFTGESDLIRYDPLTGKSYKVQLKKDSADLLSSNCISVVVDKKGRHWTGNYFEGLYLFDPVTYQARTFKIDKNEDTSINSFHVGPLYLGSNGIIYMFSPENGFVSFNTDAKKFRIFNHDAKDPSSVSHNFCHAFQEAKNGLIWFATLGGGINVFNPATEKFRSFTVNDGLAHNTVVSLVEDKNGNYWAGTEGGGISCFTPPADPFSRDCKIVFHNYNEIDGLPSNILSKMSAYCDIDGTLFFGTDGGGMFYFHPDSLKDNQFRPPIHITEFYLKNKVVSINDSNSVLRSSIEFTKEIRLNYKQNILSFSFAALNYIHPEKNEYLYKLEGYDEDWIHADASKRFATYTNLSPRKYVFKVKGSNNDGKWNETPTELLIIITPPFWQTTWFRILVALTVAAIVYSFYRYRIGQILLLQRIRNKIAADLHDDIGSTLNSISIYSEVAKKDEARRDHALTMIGESSRKIIDSISDIVWTINPENDSLDKIIFRMKSLTFNLLKAKKIDCTFKTDESFTKINLPMEIRKNFYLIFKEALNNLVKYSEATKASVFVTYESKNVSFIIRDNGIGFNSATIAYGNGINNMKRRAGEISADLNIESQPGKGTSVQLNLKL